MNNYVKVVQPTTDPTGRAQLETLCVLPFDDNDAKSTIDALNRADLAVAHNPASRIAIWRAPREPGVLSGIPIVGDNPKEAWRLEATA